MEQCRSLVDKDLSSSLGGFEYLHYLLACLCNATFGAICLTSSELVKWYYCIFRGLVWLLCKNSLALLHLDFSLACAAKASGHQSQFTILCDLYNKAFTDRSYGDNGLNNPTPALQEYNLEPRGTFGRPQDEIAVFLEAIKVPAILDSDH